jgi:hypothetical protein
LSKQSFERISWGYSWVFPAFVGSWKRLIEKYGFKRGLELRNGLLCTSFIVARQIRLTRFVPDYKHSKEKSLLRKTVFSSYHSENVSLPLAKNHCGSLASQSNVKC